MERKKLFAKAMAGATMFCVTGTSVKWAVSLYKKLPSFLRRKGISSSFGLGICYTLANCAAVTLTVSLAEKLAESVEKLSKKIDEEKTAEPSKEDFRVFDGDDEEDKEENEDADK